MVILNHLTLWSLFLLDTVKYELEINIFKINNLTLCILSSDTSLYIIINSFLLITYLFVCQHFYPLSYSCLRYPVCSFFGQFSLI